MNNCSMPATLRIEYLPPKLGYCYALCWVMSGPGVWVWVWVWVWAWGLGLGLGLGLGQILGV